MGRRHQNFKVWLLGAVISGMRFIEIPYETLFLNCPLLHPHLIQFTHLFRLVKLLFKNFDSANPLSPSNTLFLLAEGLTNSVSPLITDM